MPTDEVLNREFEAKRKEMLDFAELTKQAKSRGNAAEKVAENIEAPVLVFLREKARVNGMWHTIEGISKGTGLDVTTVRGVLTTILLPKGLAEWVNHENVDYFRATPTS